MALLKKEARRYLLNVSVDKHGTASVGGGCWKKMRNGDEELVDLTAEEKKWLRIGIHYVTKD